MSEDFGKLIRTDKKSVLLNLTEFMSLPVSAVKWTTDMEEFSGVICMCWQMSWK